MKKGSPVVWLIKEGESPPLASSDRFLRTAMLADALVSKGCRVVWFTSCFLHGDKSFIPRELDGRFSTGGFQLLLLPGPGYKRNVSLARIVHQQATAREFSRRAQKLDSPRCIVCAYPTPELCDAVARFASARKIPLVLDARDPWPDSFSGSLPFAVRVIVRPLFWYYRRLLRRSICSACELVAMSSRVLSWIKSYDIEKPSPRKGRVFYIGYDRTDAEAPCEVPPAFTSSEPLVCIFYGMFGRCHNGLVVIEAARELSLRGEDRIRFVMAGDGDLRGDWEKRAEGLENIRFTGWLDREAASAELSRAHLGFVTISGQTGRFWFGNKLFEYLAHSLAIINDTRSEVADLVDSREIGFNVAAGDSRQIADTLSGILDSPGMLREMRRKSLCLFEEQFVAEKIYEEYAQFVLHLTCESTGKASMDTEEGSGKWMARR